MTNFSVSIGTRLSGEKNRDQRGPYSLRHRLG